MKSPFHWSRFLPSTFVLNCATLGPVAYWSKAPGTLGSVAGVFLYTTFFHSLQNAPIGYLLLLLGLGYFAVVICGEAEERLMKRDPGEVILDEFIAVPLCFLFTGNIFVHLGKWSWVLLLAGFALFRLFDILKPLGIKRLQDLPGGMGVVMDDIAAAVATCACLHLLYFGLSKVGVL